MLSKFKRINKEKDIVLQSRFLKNLNPVERIEFLRLCHRRSYKEGEYVYYKGDPGTGMYFIEEGEVELTLDEKTEGGTESLLPLKAPDSFGALSIGYDLRRKSSALCKTDCVLLGFFKPDFDALSNRYPKIAVKFLETLAHISLRQLEATTAKLAEYAGEKTALEIQFNTYYENKNEDAI